MAKTRKIAVKPKLKFGAPTDSPEVIRLKRKLAEMTAEADGMEVRFDEANMASHRLRGEVAELQNMIKLGDVPMRDEMTKRIDDQKSVIEDLTKQLREARQPNQALATTIRDLKNQLLAQKAIVAEDEETMETLRGQIEILSPLATKPKIDTASDESVAFNPGMTKPRPAAAAPTLPTELEALYNILRILEPMAAGERTRILAMIDARYYDKPTTPSAP